MTKVNLKNILTAVRDMINRSSETVIRKAQSAEKQAGAAQATAKTAKTAADEAQATAKKAKTVAYNAQTTADGAKATADNARTTANNAEVTANNAKTTAESAKTTADAALPKKGGEVSGVIKSSSEIEFPRKYSSTSTPIIGLKINSDIVSETLTNRLRSYGVDTSISKYIKTTVTYFDGITIYKPNNFVNVNTVTISAEGECLDFISDNGKKPITISAKDIILHSSTADSTKKFKITVDDSGTISATEVT